MNTVKIEAFIEPGCRACATVLRSIEQVGAKLALEVRVYRRDRDSAEFGERKIVITPAVFIDGVLRFYGACTPEDIEKRVVRANYE
jgi:predicted thioredoxin/glutaredoxin